MVSEDGTEMIGNKIKSKAKGSMDEQSALAGDTATYLVWLVNTVIQDAVSSSTESASYDPSLL